MEAPEGTAARKRPEKRVDIYSPSRIFERTLLSEEVDLDGGVSTGVEDLEDEMSTRIVVGDVEDVPGGRGLW